ncbi:MAG TPA: ATP-binding protein [Anaerolineales bacterium]|nr:ATP-binding protein [Anaerolineales bacterium]
MSIRLRLSLLYSAILALTLAAFGIVLYTTQAQNTYRALQRDLSQSAAVLARSLERVPPPQNPPGIWEAIAPPVPMEVFTGDPGFRDLREREIVRLLSLEGDLIVSPFGEASDALPLSDEGLQAVQSGEEWWETAYRGEERLLIYNRPLLVSGETGAVLQVARSLTERDRSLAALSRTLIIAGLLTTIAAFGIGWVFSGTALRPIDRITQTAQAIGMESDFSRRVEHRGPNDEIGRLATTFNSMLSRLQEAYGRVSQALKQQQDFVADVSHELRTPLTTVRGNLDLLRRQPPLPPDEQTDILNDLVGESERLTRMVNDLLVLARADARRNLAEESVAMLPVMEEVCRQGQVLAPGRQVSWQTQPDLTVRGDRDALKQVLLILLDNALKHSEGAVELSAEKVEEAVLMRARDHGPGIPPEVLAHVFDRFYRGEEGHGAPGFGLGLSIARALVEAQGGTIEMHSVVGEGSEVVVRMETG